MSTRCLNKAILIGNITNDPDLRYTPNGVAVCSFGVATNRRWTTQDGEKKESAEFHRIVAWSQLAEICSQLLTKGARVYVEGRIQYREWTGSDEAKRQTTEVIIEDMILLDSRRATGEVKVEEELEKIKPEEELSSSAVEENASDLGQVEEKPKAKRKTAEKKAEESVVEDELVVAEKSEEEEVKDEKQPDEGSDIPF